MLGVSTLMASVVGGALAALLIAGGMLVSAVGFGRRFWPPGRYDWRWWTYIALSSIATGGLVIAGYFDWNSWMLPRPASYLLGLLLLFVGSSGFIAATFGLGFEESSGKQGDLRTEGFYKCSRNPQILFLFVIILGSVSYANSTAVLVVALSMGLWFVSMPFAEEPWLQERYGEEYSRYRESTPRFIDVRSIRRLRREIGRFNEDGY